MSNEEAEDLSIEKLNKLLFKHRKDFFFRIRSPNFKWNRIEICGNCIGRRYWDNMVQVVNSFVDMALNCRSIHLYDDFLGLKCKDIFELLVKLDMRAE